MKVDESGAPWPYDAVEAEDEDAGVPTWKCPGGLCECHPTEGDAERAPHTILFFDPGAKRMKGARCRVLENGELINKEHPYADGSGAVPVKFRPATRVLELEWAPADLPLGPGFPYRKRYYLDLGEGSEEGVQRRLHNLGFSVHSTIDENIRDFQRSYLQTPTGIVDHVKVELSSFHDDGALPPLPRSSDANAKTQLVGSKGPLLPLGGPSGASPPGGVKAQGSVTAIMTTVLKIRVRTRWDRMIQDAKVNVDIGASSIEQRTGKDGFVTITLTQNEIDNLTSPRDLVVVRASKLHHGPESGGATKVTHGEINVTARLDPPGFAALQLDIDSSKPSTPGLRLDTSGKAFLDLVLRDAGLNRAAVSPNVTRRMTDDEVQNELMFHHLSGAITLVPTSEFQFDHDPSTGDRGACTPSCTMKGPTPDLWVNLSGHTIADVAWFELRGWVVSQQKKGDVTPGQHFLGESFQWRNIPLSSLDQRHVVGLARFCTNFKAVHGIVAVYTQGINGDSSRADCHGYGLAMDFGGFSTKLPNTEPFKLKGQQTTPVRIGVDFNVFLHWGRIPMWDSASVAKNPNPPPGNPGDPPPWPRGSAAREDTIDFGADKQGVNNRLHFRLDPPPFQDAVPASVPQPLQGELLKVAPHFQKARVLFGAVYDFAVQEYCDSNDLLGILPPKIVDTRTPLDSHDGHFVIHPDYFKPNTPASKTADGKPGSDGRGAHVNHLHCQLGRTHYSFAGTSPPKPKPRNK